MGKCFYSNWQQVSFKNLRFNWLFIIISYFFYACILLLTSFAWKLALACVGEKIKFMQSLSITAFSFLLRYVPGKIWGMLGQVWLTKKEGGISEKKGGVCVILTTVISILSGLFLILIMFPFVSKNRFSSNLYFLFAIVPLFFVILYPPIFTKVINFGLKMFKKKGIEFAIGYNQILKLLSLYILLWITQCIGIYFLIGSFYSIKPSFFISLCGIYPAAWVIGFLSFITPAGLGVREGILSYLFSFYLPTSIGIMTSVIIRIWGLIGELIFFAIFARNIKRYI